MGNAKAVNYWPNTEQDSTVHLNTIRDEDRYCGASAATIVGLISWKVSSWKPYSLCGLDVQCKF